MQNTPRFQDPTASLNTFFYAGVSGPSIERQTPHDVADQGVQHVLVVTGGGAMHLNASLAPGKNE
jgi:hypothetical protein